MPQSTEKSITDREELFSELNEAREYGYAYSEEEQVSGIRAIGVPVKHSEDIVKGSINVFDPTTRLQGKRSSFSLVCDSYMKTLMKVCVSLCNNAI